MAAADDDQIDSGQIDSGQIDSGPGFALPKGVRESTVPGPTDVDPGTGSDSESNSEAPLTEMQQAVVDHISEAQHQLGKAERFANAPGWGLWGSGIGTGSVLGAIDRDLHMRRVSGEDDAALFLAEQTQAGDSGLPRHTVPDGGPPTPEEVHEAEMNPWPHHNMAETIEHNRQLRSAGQVDAGGGGAGGAGAIEAGANAAGSDSGN